MKKTLCGPLRYFCILCVSISASFASTPPNILLIFADDVGREVLGCYGGESYDTKNIDALAAGGMRFTHCYSMPVCHPSRITIMTGRYPARLGNPKWGSFPEAENDRNFASVLKRAGYATAVAGKWQMQLLKQNPDHCREVGFDESSVFGWHEGPRFNAPMIYENGAVREDTAEAFGPDLYTEFLIDFMKRSHEAGKPFFAYYSMALCHDVTDDIGEPVPYYRDGQWMTYTQMAESMDVMVGRMVAAVDAMGVREDTVILYTTDNGTAAGSYLKARGAGEKFERPEVWSKIGGRKVQGGKGKLNDWGTRVPLIVDWKGTIEGGQVVDDLVDFSDFLPTFAELAGEELLMGVQLDGVSFAKRLTEGEASPRAFAYSEAKGGKQHWVRTREWKLYNTGQFFDMVADPEEESSLKAADLGPEALKIREKLEAVLAGLPDPA